MLLEPQKTSYDLNFKIGKDIPVRINPFFWLIILIVGWSDNAPLIDNFGMMFCIFLSILIHELGHAFAAKRYGATNVHIVLYGMGGLAISNGKRSSKERIIELIWGPGAGFVLCLICIVLSFAIKSISHSSITMFLQYLIYINLIWGLINLIPIYPLDGGQILKEIIVIRRPWESLVLTLKISMVIAGVIAILLTGLGLLALFLGIKSYIWFSVIVFWGLGFANYQFLKQSYMAYDEPRDDFKSGNGWEKEPDWWKK